MTQLPNGIPRLDIGFLLGLVPGKTGVPRYKGVDRLPAPSGALDQEPLTDAWERYYEAEEDETLFCDLSKAQQIQEGLERSGVSVEVLYATIEELPRNLSELPHGDLWSERLADIVNRLGLRTRRLQGIPQGWRRLGFDISHPFPDFHSALIQPGLEDVVPDFQHLLNSNWLVEEPLAASSLMASANSMDYGVSPFCVLGVWEPPAMSPTT